MGELFSIHAESDLTEFTSTATNGGDFSWSAAAALAGTSGGVSCLVNDSSAMYGYKSHSAVSGLRLRLYINLNTLSVSAGAYLCLLWLDNAADDDRYIVYLLPSRVLKLYAVTDAGGWTNVGTGTLDAGENYVEFSFHAGASSGIARMWINGTLACESTSIDNDAYSDDIAKFYIGKTDLSGTISGTFYIDEIVMTDDYTTEIGPVAAAGGALHRLVSPVRLGMLSGGGLAL